MSKKVLTENDIKNKNIEKFKNSEQRAILKQLVGKPQKRVWCSLPWYALQLDKSDGFGPCCHLKFKGMETPNNLKETMKVWNHPKFVKLRKDLLVGNVSQYPCANAMIEFLEMEKIKILIKVLWSMEWVVFPVKAILTKMIIIKPLQKNILKAKHF